MVCVSLKALRKQAKRGNVDVEKVGIPYSISMHRETIVADYKRIAAMLPGRVGRADSRRMGGSGCTAE